MYLAIFLILMLLTGPAESESISTKTHPSLQRGMCYAAWEKDSYLSKPSDASLEALSAAGAKSVAIVTTWYQRNFDSTHIMPTDKTPSDKGLKHIIKKAHKLGMSVMLKPHVDLLNQADSHWRADIGFQSEDQWQKWFENYVTFISYYAKLAEKEKVEFFCIGTELSFAATKTDYWRERIIPEVRKLFSGQITYASNWDDYKDIKFWDLLDYAGIDAYFPVAYSENPSYRDIRQGWQKWSYEIETWQATVNKPVIFTEIGYCSADSAASNPWEVAMSGNPNLKIQRDLYRAVFETFWDKSWFSGLYWWAWNPSPNSGGANNRRFTPQNKPAEREMTRWYTKRSDKDLPEKEIQAEAASADAIKDIKALEGIKRFGLELQPNTPLTHHLAVEPLSERIKERKGEKSESIID